MKNKIKNILVDVILWLIGIFAGLIVMIVFLLIVFFTQAFIFYILWNHLSQLEDLVFFEQISYWTSFALVVFLNFITNIIFPKRLFSFFKNYISDYHKKVTDDLKKKNTDDDLPIK